MLFGVSGHHYLLNERHNNITVLEKQEMDLTHQTGHKKTNLL